MRVIVWNDELVVEVFDVPITQLLVFALVLDLNREVDVTKINVLQNVKVKVTVLQLRQLFPDSFSAVARMEHI